MSRTVSEDGYYEIEFNSLGIHLTQITKDEINEIPFSHWVYMNKGQRIEGSDINNYKKIPVQCILEDEQLSLDLNVHVCQYKEYHGLIETGKFCVICGTKQSD